MNSPYSSINITAFRPGSERHERKGEKKLLGCHVQKMALDVTDDEKTEGNRNLVIYAAVLTEKINRMCGDSFLQKINAFIPDSPHSFSERCLKIH